MIRLAVTLQIPIHCESTLFSTALPSKHWVLSVPTDWKQATPRQQASCRRFDVSCRTSPSSEVLRRDMRTPESMADGALVARDRVLLDGVALLYIVAIAVAARYSGWY